MAVTSSITQAISFSESGGSGIATSNRTTSVAPQVTMTTSATGVQVVYSTTINLVGPAVMDINLHDTNAGDSDPDDRGSIRFTKIHGIILNVESGELSFGQGSGESPISNTWAGTPVATGGFAFDHVGPSSMSLFGSQSFAPVMSISRLVRISVPDGSTAVGSVTFIGEGAVL